MKYFLFLIVIIANSLAFITKTTAASFKDVVDKSEVIVVARIVSIVPGDTIALEREAIRAKNHGRESPVDEAIYNMTKIAPGGSYQFQVVKYLKGVGPLTIQIDVPIISSIQYNFAKFSVSPGHNYILLLKQTPQKQLLLANPAIPLIPLADKIQIINSEGDVLTNIFSNMAVSLKDASVRAADSYILRNEVSPQIVITLVPYCNDQDLIVRNNVLFCLAKNQQISAIPRIVALNELQMKEGSNADSIEALADFINPEAVSNLNTAIINQSRFVRYNTISSLANVADKTSIPYLTSFASSDCVSCNVHWFLP